MSEKIVDVRIKVMRELKGKCDETLIEDYKNLIRNGHGDRNWFLERHEIEILERMNNELPLV